MKRRKVYMNPSIETGSHKSTAAKAYYHLPGLFEFYDFYKVFLPLYREHREYFYDWCEIGSVYGAPAGCIWGGGREGIGNTDSSSVLSLMNEYGISSRLTFSNSLLRAEHLADHKCNDLCRQLAAYSIQNGVIVHSDFLLEYLQQNYPGLYFVSSTTKVLTGVTDFKAELNRPEFKYVVPDFRLNKEFELLSELSPDEKDKVEFLCNECCWIGCADRKACYESVSRKVLNEEAGKNRKSGANEHICKAPYGNEGYKFSLAMQSPAFIGIDDIYSTYLPMGFTNFKIEGRTLGSAILLEFLLYYMTKPECRLLVREAIYLDAMLDLF